METSSSPLLSAGPDWRHYTQGNGSSNSLSIPSASSPSPARTWGPQLLGGETYNKRDSLNSIHNDPIGSRPSSRADAATQSIQDSLRPIGTQRPSASVTAGVFAAASSAVARSRATSPANFPINLSDGVTPQIGMMGLGTSYKSHHPFRLENSSSPSFVSAQSSQQQTNANVQVSSHLAESKDLTGTPTLVVEGFQTSRVAPLGQKMDPSFSATRKGGDGSNGQAYSSFSSTESASFVLNNKKSLGLDELNGQISESIAADVPQKGSIQRTMTPLRSDTGASFKSDPRQRTGISSPAPLLNLPWATNSSRGHQNSMTLASSGNAGSPPRNLVGNDSLAAPLPRHAEPLPILEADSQTQASPFLLDILDRLARLESSVKDIHRNMSGLSRNVSLLLDRTRNLPASSNVNTPSQKYPTTLHQQAQSAATSTQSTSEEIRAVSAQIAQLGSQIPQLMMQSNSSNTHLTGLGLGTATPPTSGSNLVNPLLLHNQGGSSRLAYTNDSPRVVSGSGVVGYTNQTNSDRNNRLSPRPTGSPSPSSRRWNSMTPVPGDNSAQNNSRGAMLPPDANVIVTKWEHLNLHPDLLRCILKYGLGPPNKIQQRALPFLLRGSDIIAQAPPTQERIASYVIPVLQLVLDILRSEPMPPNVGVRGPIAIIISTTVDQATQAQRMALGLGSALGVRVHIAAASGLEVSQEATGLIQSQPQIVVGTPQKMMDLFNYLANKTKGAVSLDDIRMVVLDEVDQLIARNLADYVSTLLRILPQPRKMIASPSPSPGLPSSFSSSSGGDAFRPFESSVSGSMSQPSAVSISSTERQTAIFSNTVPQDVLNFAQSIHLRESVRVLVRRDTASNQGNAGQNQMGVNNQSIPSLSILANAGGYQQHHSSNILVSSPNNNQMNLPPDVAAPASLRGLRQYYLYVPVSTSEASIGVYQSPNPTLSHISYAVEMKLEVITDLLEDMEFGQAVIYTSTSATHEAVTYKLASKGIEALALHRDMATSTRQQVIQKYRSAINPNSRYQQVGNNIVGVYQSSTTTSARSTNMTKKALVVYDVEISSIDVGQVPLVVFYDLPRSVEEYKDKIACTYSSTILARASVCINVVTGSGGPRGDIEMLRTIECHFGCKMAELPMNSSQLLNS